MLTATPRFEFIDGNQAIMRGAFDAGCTFFAGYPITPATSLLLEAVRVMPSIGGVAIQTEDELAGISMCIAASMAGSKAMTATSGPGVSLYSENIGLAIMGEVPLVIVDSQRLGPATGGATSHGEGDVQFVRWSTAGGFPIIALAPRDLKTSYELTVQAFNLAERYRTPVFLLTSKELSLTRSSADSSLWERLEPVERRLYQGEAEAFLPYATPERGEVPLFAPIGAPFQVRFTTSIHGPEGIITNDLTKRRDKLEHLNEKIRWDKPGLSLFEEDIAEGADTLVVAYGLAAQSALDAVETLRRGGHRVSLLVLYTLWPVLEGVLTRCLERHKRVIVPEHNNGQYLQEVERFAVNQRLTSVQRFDGTIISPGEIVRAVLEEV
ncbi:2-oxoglutarate synthase subunit alpha [soil metagenome]|jgi:2-oxoglutarate ferredoxin oxidoreductase subunit alpha|nr:pyruvate flavodoxin/ferredoxin oxidoreductase [Deinococcota bacterium]